MNREDIIRMAHEVGLEQDGDTFFSFNHKEMDVDINDLERFATLVASAEREACAKTCEQISNEINNWPSAFEGVTSETKFIRKTGEIISQPFIEAIRARGQA